MGNWSEALASAIEVAIAIAGFSGIVAAVGRRGAGSWTPDDQLRLRVLLTASGVAGIFAFLPFIILDTGLDPRLFWRLGTGAQVAWSVAITLHRRRQAARMGAALYAPLPALLAFYLPALGVLVFNTAVLGAAWPYVLGVLMQLSVAFITFARLLLDSWRPPA